MTARRAAASTADDAALWAELSDALLSAVEALPGKRPRSRGTRGAPGYVVAFSAPDRDDARPSAYLMPWGDKNGDGRPVWGDTGTSRKGGGLELAELLDVDVRAIGFGTNGRTPAAPKPTAVRTLEDLARGAERCHVWRDADGKPLLAVIVHRNDDGSKRVWNARPSGAGWEAGRPNAPDGGWPLYRLQDLLVADPSCAVCVVEGEKAADELIALGLVATTTLGGAGKARGMDWTPLADRHVVVLPDHDAPGVEHADVVATCALGARAALVAVVPLPGEPWGDALPDKHGRDVSNWLADGGTVERLEAAVKAVKPVDPLDTVLRAWPRLTPWGAWGEARPIDWTVPDLVPSGAFVLLYGPPGCGKSLVALEWAARAASDGLALYVVGEGAGGLAGRLEAWRRVHGEDPPEGLHLWRGAVQIAEPAEIDEFVGATLATAAALGLPPRLVVLDTLACCTLGRDENNASDAGLFAAAVGRLQATGAAVVVIHHPDKGGKGPRGSGAFLGAADVSIRADANGAAHTLTVEKSKDGGREGWRVLYRREVVELGRDEHGDPVTGAAAMRGTTHAAGEQGARPERRDALTANRRRFLEACAALWAGGELATMAAIIDRSGLAKNRAVDCARWARAAACVEGGDGAPYMPGQGWPASIPRVDRSGPVWTGNGPAGSAEGGPVWTGGPIKDPGPVLPEPVLLDDEDEVLL